MVAVTQILLVEDDADLQVTTRLVLEREGFEVTVIGNGQQALEAIRTQDFDLALVDVMIPGLDGIRLTRQARQLGHLPVVMLTARDLPHDQILGLEAGADDYVVKPFDGEVLIARIRAVLRRAGTGDQHPATIRHGDLEIDLPGMSVARGGQPIELTATEFRLLRSFVLHLGIVLSRTQLLGLVWDDAEWTDPRLVDVTLQRLRAKIGATHIETVRGVGYKMPRSVGGDQESQIAP